MISPWGRDRISDLRSPVEPCADSSWLCGCSLVPLARPLPRHSVTALVFPSARFYSQNRPLGAFSAALNILNGALCSLNEQLCEQTSEFYTQNPELCEQNRPLNMFSGALNILNGALCEQNRALRDSDRTPARTADAVGRSVFEQFEEVEFLSSGGLKHVQRLCPREGPGP